MGFFSKLVESAIALNPTDAEKALAKAKLKAVKEASVVLAKSSAAYVAKEIKNGIEAGNARRQVRQDNRTGEVVVDPEVAELEVKLAELKAKAKS